MINLIPTLERNRRDTEENPSTREYGWPKDLEMEGWSDSICLRTSESKSHVLAVTALTLKLARLAGVPESELTYWRNGAILHDVGKLGVPERILRKNGALTESEWQIVRRHPNFAYDLLFPINYFQLCLAIPFSHHERWDGTGYPQRLKGEEIPLSARLFALADTWDSLTSIKPFRPAWSKEKAREYIQSQAGKQFDPAAVELFRKLITT